MLLNERLAKKTDSAFYFNTLSEVKRRAVPVEKLGSGHRLSQAKIDPKEKNEVGFNVDYFFTRFTSFKADTPWEYSANWEQETKPNKCSYSAMPGMEPAEPVGAVSVGKASSQKLLNLNNLAMLSRRGSQQSLMTSHIKIDTARPSVPITKRSPLFFSTKYWRERNPKFKSKQNQPDNAAYEDLYQAEEENETLDLRMLMLHSNTYGPATPAKLKASHLNLRDSLLKPAKKSMVIKNMKTPTNHLAYKSLQSSSHPEFLKSNLVLNDGAGSTSDVSDITKTRHLSIHRSQDLRDLKVSDDRDLVKPLYQSMKGTCMDTREVDGAQKNLGKYLEEQSKKNKEAQDVFMSTHLRNLVEDDCWMIFRFMLTEAVDLEGYSVLNNEASMDLPKALLFAKQFKFLIVNLDSDKIMSGKATILKTNWLRLAPNVVVPSLKDLVLYCCDKETDVALVFLLVGFVSN